MVMRAVVVYESMFGNTHAIADAIGRGLGGAPEPVDDVVVIPVSEASRERLGDADLLVVGGPTHFHGMSRARTRSWAASTAKTPKKGLALEPDAQGPGLRDWLRTLNGDHSKCAAFDTRFRGSSFLRGRASKVINRRLRGHGYEAVAKPESFFVSLENHLDPGEEVRAQEWGQRLGASVRAESVVNTKAQGQPPTSRGL
jgi:hypothetical protein